MKMKLLKAWLRIKLRQWSSAAGLGVLAIAVAKQLGYEIPPELVPYVDTIGMALAGIVLFFMRESGETDAIRDAKHQIEMAAHDQIPATPAAAATPAPAALRPGGVRSDPSVHAVTRDKSPRDANNPGGGFNG